MTIDLLNPAHILVLCLLAIAWGAVCTNFDDWFDSDRFFPEVLYVLAWVVLIIISCSSLVSLIILHWNP